MATNKNASFRYRVLNDCFLEGSRKWTVIKLVEHVSNQLDEHYGLKKGISERQIKEDIHIMRSLPPRGFSAPIVCKEGAYFYDDPTFSIEKKSLNTDDIRSLTEAVSLLRQFQGLPHFREIYAILTKIKGKALTNDPNESIISFENTPFLRGYEFLEQLYQSIREKQVLRITYKAFLSNKDELYTINPYFLKEYRGRWYVFGLALETDSIYNLPLDRIVTIEITKIHYNDNLRFDPISYFRDIVGVTRRKDEVAETVLLQVNIKTASYLETRPIHHSQLLIKTDSTEIIFQYKLIPNFEFIAEILRLGELAQIISPKSLRDNIANRIALVNKLYSEVFNNSSQ